jgi:GH35 family endo-1,4-beta-xylanase
MRLLLNIILAFFVEVASAAAAETSTQVLVVDTITNVDEYREPGDQVTQILVSDPAIPFKTALQVSRVMRSDVTYAAALRWSSQAAIKSGDLLVAEFYVRNTAPQKGTLNLDVTFQLNDEPYTPSLSSSAPVEGTTWRKYAVPFRAIQNFAKGSSSLQIRYSIKPQNFDIGGVQVTNYGQVPGVIPEAIAGTFAYHYPGRGDPKAEWRVAALKRIDTFRKGEIALRVVDQAGRPLPDAVVTLEQTDPAFIWGSATSAISLTCKADAGDGGRPCPSAAPKGSKPLTAADYRRLRKELLANFNGGSFYNDLKWTDWHYDQQIALDGIAWMKRNRLTLTRGHNLIWPSFEPDYLMPRDVINRNTPADTVSKVIDEHFAQILGTLKGQIPEWDVLNEPFSNTDIQGRLASPDVKAIKGVLPISSVATWYANARKYDPMAKLFLNDFGILENFNGAKFENDVALVKYIQSQGAPVDGIGFQGHFGAGGPVFSDMQKSIDAFSPLVQTMSLSEFDFETLDPNLQADLMGDVMTFIYSQPKFNLFQVWGFWDGDHWLGNGPLFTRDWVLKPSGAVWQNLIRQTWRTGATGTTNQAAVYNVNAFYGTYDVAVTTAGKTCTTKVKLLKPGEVVVKNSC